MHFSDPALLGLLTESPLSSSRLVPTLLLELLCSQLPIEADVEPLQAAARRRAP